MLAIAKSRSVIVGVVPAGSVTSEMWIVSLMSLPVEVDDHLLGDVAGGHHQLDLGAHLGQHAAAAQARGLVAVDVLDRDEEGDARALGEAQEVDVGRQVLDHVALHGRGR